MPRANIGTDTIWPKDCKLGVDSQPGPEAAISGASQNITAHNQANRACALNKCVNVIFLLLLLL
jgi:hypothetical protein